MAKSKFGLEEVLNCRQSFSPYCVLRVKVTPALPDEDTHTHTRTHTPAPTHTHTHTHTHTDCSDVRLVCCGSAFIKGCAAEHTTWQTERACVCDITGET